MRAWSRAEGGEPTLASAATDGGGRLTGTRDALYLPVGSEPSGGSGRGRRLAWEDVQSAEWDPESSTLRVLEVGTWGEERPEHAFVVAEPDRLLQLVRERVSASIVIQRRTVVRGRAAVHVVARRAPRGDGPIRWFFEYDERLDPHDPRVRRVADALLASAREEIGEASAG